MIEFDRIGLGRPGPEVIKKRTPGGKTFDMGNGRLNLRIAPTPIHFNAEDGLNDIDLHPEEYRDFYYLRKAPYTLEISKGMPQIIYRDLRREIVLTLEGIDGTTLPMAALSKVDGVGHCLKYPDALGDGDLCIMLKSTGIHTEQHIRSEAGIRTLTWKVRQNIAEPIITETRVAGTDRDGREAEVIVTRNSLVKIGRYWEHSFEERFTGNIMQVADESTRRLEAVPGAQYPVRIVS